LSFPLSHHYSKRFRLECFSEVDPLVTKHNRQASQ